MFSIANAFQDAAIYNPVDSVKKGFFPLVYTVIVRNLANGYHVLANKVSIYLVQYFLNSDLVSLSR